MQPGFTTDLQKKYHRFIKKVLSFLPKSTIVLSKKYYRFVQKVPSFFISSYVCWKKPISLLKKVDIVIVKYQCQNYKNVSGLQIKSSIVCLRMQNLFPVFLAHVKQQILSSASHKDKLTGFHEYEFRRRIIVSVSSSVMV
ncbi:hypothetical protein ETF27_10310 [Prevotella brunnea]|uniref:Uncharacterized protein n=1 Tax=Prevotella brunnea TaxID=2508867 RepID=A0A5C8GA35_9BACT|nr:hypothetical protein ETF27_10310 [Prevotella brunnea]